MYKTNKADNQQELQITLEDLLAMHSCYHNDLNGNGFLNKQMDKVMNLEVKGIGVK